MTIQTNIIYRAVVKNTEPEKKWITLTEENNVLVCWLEETNYDQEIDSSPLILWYMRKFSRNEAIEKAVREADAIRNGGSTV